MHSKLGKLFWSAVHMFLSREGRRGNRRQPFKFFWCLRTLWEKCRLFNIFNYLPYFIYFQTSNLLHIQIQCASILYIFCILCILCFTSVWSVCRVCIWVAFLSLENLTFCTIKKHTQIIKLFCRGVRANQMQDPDSFAMNVFI
jgi:hypothetical protein